MDRIKVLHGPWTQTYGETNYLKKNLSFGQNQGIAWSSDSNLWGNQLLKENPSTRLGLTTHSAPRMIPLAPQKYVQMQVQRPIGMGKLEFWDVIPNKSYAQSFIHVKITNSKTMRFATIVNIGKGNEHVI